MVVAPSDHLILKEEVFLNDVRTALEFADQHEALLTLGIRPSRPDTGYGYIQYEKGSEAVKKVRQFTEKPPLADAERYLASGDYLWNAGIFIWKVSDVLNAFSRYAPEIHRILGADKEAYNTEREDEFIRKAYPTTPSISVDYALMEQADNVFTLPVDFGWSDLGTWASLHENAEKDNHRNKVFADQCLVQETTNTLIRVPREKLVVVRGLDNYIVVDEKDVLLIWPKSEEQAIKAARKEIEEKLGDQYL
jgi:mannose-1-phosphate guanylyltransferase